MRLLMLGTGHAMVTHCYNTCYLLQDENQSFMVDAGGGNGVLLQMERAGVDYHTIHDIFVTHKHVDHIMGVVWMMRLITQDMVRNRFDGDVRIYGHDEVIHLLRMMANGLLQPKEAACLDQRLHLIEVKDGETLHILNREVTFFDIDSTKAKQFGYSMRLKNGRKLTCCGDEPCSESGKVYVKDSEWLLHEAFCLHSEAHIYHPYEIHHSTAKDACELAAELGVSNVILYHTEQEHLAERKLLYTQEGRRYFDGGIYVPEDLEEIMILEGGNEDGRS